MAPIGPPKMNPSVAPVVAPAAGARLVRSCAWTAGMARPSVRRAALATMSLRMGIVLLVDLGSTLGLGNGPTSDQFRQDSSRFVGTCFCRYRARTAPVFCRKAATIAGPL